MPRPWKLGRRFAASVARIGVKKNAEKMAALTATMRAIYEAKELPAYCDARVAIPPLRVGYVRRVRRFNLWLRFEIVNDVVFFTLLVTEAPLPIYDDEDE